MGTEGGRAVQRDKGVRKLAVVVGLQNVLVAACLLVTLYVYWGVQRDVHRELQWLEEDNVHIQFMAIADIEDNGKLQFGGIHSSHMMGLADKSNDTISINCTGPYLLYMDVCYNGHQKTRGMLQLQVVGSTTPVFSVNLTDSHDDCRGLHSIAYLKAKNKASLYFYSTDNFKIKNVTVGMSYLLGRRCDY